MFFFVQKKWLVISIFMLSAVPIIIFSKYLPVFFQKTPALSWTIAPHTFFIDPGHGGIFPGKVATDGTLEKDINLSIGQNLASLLSQSAAEVILSRTTDSDLLTTDNGESLLKKQQLDLHARTQLAIGTNCDYYISVHCNSIPSPQWHGAQVFYKPNDTESQHLAETIQYYLTCELQNTTRQALPRDDTYIFKNTPMPAVIIECGFLSNEEECNLLKDDFYQQKIAYAIFLGISDYLSD